MMFAYSSIGQIGYIILGATLMNNSGLIGSMYHFLTHAIVKGGLFLTSGIVLYSLSTTRIDDLDGLFKKCHSHLLLFSFCIFHDRGTCYLWLHKQVVSCAWSNLCREMGRHISNFDKLSSYSSLLLENH